jgi:hypothetical protein
LYENKSPRCSIFCYIYSCIKMQILWFYFFEYIPSRSIVGSYGRFSFSFLMKLHSDFHSVWPNLHSHQYCSRVHFCPAHWTKFVFIFFIISTQSGIRYNLNVVLICIFLMTKDDESIVMLFLSICTCSFQNSLLISCAHLLVELFVFFSGTFFLYFVLVYS